MAGEEGIPPILRALVDEVPKLEESIRLLRLLAAPDEPEEATEPLRLVDDAIAVVRLHPALRGIRYRVEARDGSPVLAKPVQLIHQIVVALVQASANMADGEVVVRVTAEGEYVLIEAGERAVRARTLMAARAG